MNKNQERLLKKSEEILPGIKDIFELSVITLKLINPKIYDYKISFNYDYQKNPLIRWHIYNHKHENIFILFINKSTHEMFARNELKADGTLSIFSEKIFITNINELQNLLNKLVMEWKG